MQIFPAFSAAALQARYNRGRPSQQRRAANTPDAKAKSPFTEQSYYQGAVDWAYGEGMIDGSFDPKGSCTRSSAMVYIWQRTQRRRPCHRRSSR